MSEESETPQAGDPVAISLALAGASREKADAFLDEQRHHLREQFKQLRIELWEKRLGVILRVATAVVGIAVAAGFALMVWDAAHSKGLIIEPFSVPPDLAQRGVTGEVVASQMIDKLTEMTTHESSRAVQSYANNWGDNIKVEIPETGVSIGELQSFLKEWLGHDIRISGEIFHNGNQITVSARTGGDVGASFSGADSDLDSLLQKAAEHVYEVTQPYRYANYLDRNYAPNGLADRINRATVIYRKLIAGDDLTERAWAWNGLGTIEFNIHGNNRLAAEYYKKSIATVPDFTIGYFALASRNLSLNQEMERYDNYIEADRLLSREPVPELNPHYTTYARYFAKGAFAMLTGDYGAAIPQYEAGAELPDDFSVLQKGNFIGDAIQAMALQHDLPAARAYHQRELGNAQIGNTPIRLDMDREAQDWNAIIGEETALKARIAQAQNADDHRGLQGNYDAQRYSFAQAKARLGDFPGAEAMIAPTPADDDNALRTRGLIAEMRGQHMRADWWFARAEARAPHVPFADEMWGRALLMRGDADGAVAKFTLASQKGPHFADALEGWGEALMAKKDSGAAAKFEDAEKYAPNWGKLHLKWGEALAAAGKKDEAQKQFALAATFDLSAAEKVELATVSGGHG